MTKKFDQIKIISASSLPNSGKDNVLSLEDISVGGLIQLLPSKGQILQAQFIGYIAEKSMLVTAPKSLSVKINQLINVRIFLQGNLYSYQATVLVFNTEPIKYLHLSYPQNVQVKALRGQMRVRTIMNVRVSSKDEFSNGKRSMKATLTDFSQGGASIESDVQFGNVEDKIIVTSKFRVDDIEREVSIPCLICQIRGLEDAKTKQVVLQHGIKFAFVEKADEVFVQQYINQQIDYAQVLKIL